MSLEERFLTMTGNNKVWRAPVAGLASVAMLATMGVSTLTANAANTYDLTKVYADGTSETIHGVTFIDGAQLVPGADSAGQTVTGWYTEEGNGNGTKVQPGTKITADTTIYEHSSADVYTVNFANPAGKDVIDGVAEYDGDTDTDTTYVAEGDSLAAWQIPGDDGVANHQVLAGWTANGGAVDFNASMNPADYVSIYNGEASDYVTFTAVAADAWTVSFYGDNAITGYANYDLYVGDNAVASPYQVDVNKDNSSYTGTMPTAKLQGQPDKIAAVWKTSRGTDDKKLTDFDPSAKVTSDMNLYPFNAVEHFTVTFDDQVAGTENATADVAKDATVSAPADPTRADGKYKYAFAGWYTTPACADADAYDFNTKVTKDITLYAKWIVSAVKVSFQPGYGSAKPTEMWFEDGDVFETPEMTRDDYVFEGWGTITSVEGNEVDVEDLAGYQVTFVNGGTAADPTAKLQVVTPNGADGFYHYTLAASYKAEWYSYEEALYEFESLVNVNMDADKQKLYTADSYEAYVESFKKDYTEAKKAAAKGGYSRSEYDALLAQLKDMQAKLVEVGDTNLYRVYNPNNGDHYFTTSQAEASALVKLGWNAEGAPYKVVLNRVTKFGTPIYSAYNPNTGEHLLTEEGEAEALAQVGWVNEGIKFYTVQNGSASVVRVYNPNTNGPAHLYTDASEANGLAKIGWSIDNGGAPVFTLD